MFKWTQWNRWKLFGWKLNFQSIQKESLKNKEFDCGDGREENEWGHGVETIELKHKS